MLESGKREYVMSELITAEKFKEATGHDPILDDLERCNCPDAGEIGHSMCGWNHEQNCPQFMARPEK